MDPVLAPPAAEWRPSSPISDVGQIDVSALLAHLSEKYPGFLDNFLRPEEVQRPAPSDEPLTQYFATFTANSPAAEMTPESSPSPPAGPSAPVSESVAEDFSADAEMPPSEEFQTVVNRSQKRKLKATKSPSAPPPKVPAKEKSRASKKTNPATQESGDSTMEEPRTERVPPLYVREKSRWDSLIPALDRQGIIFTDARSTAIGIRVQCPNSENHRRLTATLRAENIGFHTYALQEERVLRTVIRGLPCELSTERVKEDLQAQGIPVIEVHRMYQRWTKKPYDMVLVICELSPAGHKIKNLRSVCRLSGLKFESPEGKGRIGQCHNCQNYGHSARFCFAQPRCVKCLIVGHSTVDCSRKQPTEIPPSCVLCGEQGHPANYRGCKKAPRGQKPWAHPSGRRSAPSANKKARFVDAPQPTTNSWSKPLYRSTAASVPKAAAPVSSPSRAQPSPARTQPPPARAQAPPSSAQPKPKPAPPSPPTVVVEDDDSFASNWQYVNHVIDTVDLDELDAYVRESRVNPVKAMYKYASLIRAIKSLRVNING